MRVLATLRRWARALKTQALVVYYAARDRRTPWGVRLLAATVAAYAFSPIDLIPDFIPVLGLLDDLVLVPLGIALVVRLLPGDVLEAARERARQSAQTPVGRVMAAVIVLVWLAGAVVLVLWWARSR